jgi:hypothetical protein
MRCDPTTACGFWLCSLCLFGDVVRKNEETVIRKSVIVALFCCRDAEFTSTEELPLVKLSKSMVLDN